MSFVPLSEQLRCARRELAMRRNVYPKWVANGKMKQEDADREIAGMQAIVLSLEVLSMPTTHVHLEDGGLERIDQLTLEQARQVIARLCDELQTMRREGAGDVRPGV